MQVQTVKSLTTLFSDQKEDLLKEWLTHQMCVSGRSDILSETSLRKPCNEFLDLLQTATKSEDSDIHESDEWQDMRDFLMDLSRTRALQDFTPSETRRVKREAARSRGERTEIQVAIRTSGRKSRGANRATVRRAERGCRSQCIENAICR
ncbi:MAG: RsbRD N-terminal domain-containing protein [Cyanobacteria bacterium]|nr:RsbRD N-terminal domain-containing protein [Cyanobacteriota bacterium]